MDRNRITSAFLDGLGCDKTYSLQRIRLDGSEVELLVWDVPLTSRFRHLTWLNLRKAAGVVLCYDVTLYHTFQFIREEWSNHYNGMKPQLQAKKMLVGLQYGTDSKRGVLKSEAENFAINNDMVHLEISLGEKCMVEFLLTGLLADIKQSELRKEQKDNSRSTHSINYFVEKKCLLM